MKADSSLADLAKDIPGYDPFASAGECRFERKAAQKALEFFPAMLRHVEGTMAGQPFQLERWQQSIIANLFGWFRADGSRRYREALLFVPRKNGKTPLAAGIALYILFCDPEFGQQNYLAAGEREQAGYLFRQCKGMVQRKQALEKNCRCYGSTAAAGQSQSIVRQSRNSFLRVVSADADTKHGGNTSLAIIDELHVQPNRDLVDVFTTSMASANRKNPLLIYLTTSDFERESICNEKHDYACKVRDGVIDDPSFLPIIYEASKEDDWTSPETWRKANPNLGVSVSLEYLERECKRAQETPAYENTFKRLHLNLRTEQDVRWLSLDSWDTCKREFTAADLEGRPCFGGLDLASTTDIAAFVLVFPGEPLFVLPFFWVPKERMRARERKDRVPYATWAGKGLIRATDGNVIDYDVIRRDINRLRETFDVRKVAVDRWNASQIVTQLIGDGLEIEYFGQGFASMTAPTKQIERLVVSRQLAHDGHAVLRWMVSNASVEEDAAGNQKPSKKKSTEKIDGVVAAIMAVGISTGEAVYDESLPEMVFVNL